MSRELPIMMTGDSVRAILAGTKTQTRRVCKVQPCNPQTFGTSPIWGSGIRNGRYGIHAATNVNGERVDRWLNTRYSVGDLIWVKETWWPCDAGHEGVIHYRADGESIHARENNKWRSPMYMPKWAARIWLRVTSVRIERLQSINWIDAIAEGMRDTRRCATRIDSNNPKSPVAQYRVVWESINGKKNPWESNPWVEVYTFKREEPK